MNDHKLHGATRDDLNRQEEDARVWSDGFRGYLETLPPAPQCNVVACERCYKLVCPPETTCKQCRGVGFGSVCDACIDLILEKLEEFEPYIYHEAATSNSVYIKFEKIPHSLRVSDHAGGPKYAYRWNIGVNVQKFRQENRHGRIMYFYPIESLDRMADHMKATYRSEL